MTRAAAFASLLALLLALTGCAGADPAEQALLETATKLDDVRSGTISLRLIVDDQAQSDGSGLGFQLEGSFGFGRDDPLPTADLEYTRIAGSDATTLRFLSTGERAYVEIDGRAYELPEEQTRRFAGPGAQPLDRLRLYDWVAAPELAGSARRDGVEVDRIRADVDVAAAIRDVVRFARALGADVGEVDETAAEAAARAVRESRFELLTGSEDRLLRRLVIDISFAPPSDLDVDVAGVVGGRITLELDLAKVNQPIEVDAPEDARPYAELVASP